jgi:hypothetical protein
VGVPQRAGVQVSHERGTVGPHVPLLDDEVLVAVAEAAQVGARAVAVVRMGHCRGAQLDERAVADAEELPVRAVPGELAPVRVGDRQRDGHLLEHGGPGERVHRIAYRHPPPGERERAGRVPP